METGERIKFIRKANKLTQGQFAQKLNFSDAYIGVVENNKQQPSFQLVSSILKAFMISADWLFRGFGYKEYDPDQFEKSKSLVDKFDKIELSVDDFEQIAWAVKSLSEWDLRFLKWKNLILKKNDREGFETKVYEELSSIIYNDEEMRSAAFEDLIPGKHGITSRAFIDEKILADTVAHFLKTNGYEIELLYAIEKDPLKIVDIFASTKSENLIIEIKEHLDSIQDIKRTVDMLSEFRGMLPQQLKGDGTFFCLALPKTSTNLETIDYLKKELETEKKLKKLKQLDRIFWIGLNMKVTEEIL